MKKVTITVPDFFDKNYPNWKKNLWGMLRAFVASFIATLIPMIQTITPETFESWYNMRIFWLPVIIASVTAGVVGVGKFIRDLFEQSSLAQKLPI